MDGERFANAVASVGCGLGRDFAGRWKQAGQLVGKIRFAAAQWIGLPEGDAWMRYAAHANEMARLIARAFDERLGIAAMFPVEANRPFSTLSPQFLAALRSRGWELHPFVGLGGVRFTCS